MKPYLAAALLLGATGLSAQETVTLRMAPPAGQVNRYRTVIETFVSPAPRPGVDTAQPMLRNTMYQTRTVQAAMGENRTIVEVIDSMQSESPAMAAMGSGGPGGGMGGGPGGGRGMGGQMAEMMRGLTTTMQMDSRGRVVSFEVSGGNFPPQFADRMRSAQRPNSGFSLPAGPVRVGESWTDTSTMTVGGGRGPGQPAAQRTTFRLERIENRAGARVAVISVTGTLTPAAPAGPPPAAGSGGPGGGPGGMRGATSPLSGGAVTGEVQYDLTNQRSLTSDLLVTATMGEMTARTRITTALLGG
jgi:hypothetical protein